MRSRYLVALTGMCLPALALAVGGGSTQGTLFLGQGLDWQHTATEERPFLHFNSMTFPPNPGNYLTSDVKITLLNCVSLSQVHARCNAMVGLRPAHPYSQFCGQWLREDGTQVPVVLYAFSGRFNERGYFSVEISEQFPITLWPLFPWAPSVFYVNVTLACGITHFAQNDQAHTRLVEWPNLGAMGKCIVWPDWGLGGNPVGFPPGVSGAANRKFNACIRAVRADYCGDGVSYTWDQTAIWLYDLSAGGTPNIPPDPPMPANSDLSLEANWDEHGAICLHHLRYELLAPDCRERLKFKKATQPDGGQLYYCRDGTPDFNGGLLKDYSSIH